MSAESSNSPPGFFPTTRWSMVAHAASKDTHNKESSEALEYLCRLYWKPIYTYARSNSTDREEAEDLVQGFFHHILKSALFSKACPNRGQFRSFILQSFRNYWSTVRRRNAALRRGGDKEHLSLDWIDSSAGEAHYLALQDKRLSPEALFDSQWAQLTLDAAMARLREEFQDKDRADLYEALSPFLAEPTTEHGYAQELAGRLGVSASSIRQNMKRLRKRFGELLRELISETLSDTSGIGVDEELRSLQQAL